MLVSSNPAASHCATLPLHLLSKWRSSSRAQRAHGRFVRVAGLLARKAAWALWKHETLMQAVMSGPEPPGAARSRRQRRRTQTRQNPLIHPENPVKKKKKSKQKLPPSSPPHSRRGAARPGSPGGRGPRTRQDVLRPEHPKGSMYLPLANTGALRYLLFRYFLFRYFWAQVRDNEVHGPLGTCQFWV